MLGDGLFLHAAAQPDAVAVVEADGNAVSYRRLAELASGTQVRLRELGVGPGDRVGVHLPKSVDAMAAMYGILASGATYVPVDVQSPAGRVARILTDGEVRAVFTLPGADAAFRAGAGSAPVTCWELDRVGSGVGIESWAPPADPRPEPSGAAERWPAYILYTSGSTGQPKGVVVSHGAAESFIRWGAATFALVPADRLLSLAPFHFDLSIFDVFAAHHAGATVVLVGEPTARNPRRLAALLSERRVTVWYSTPTALGALLTHGRLADHAHTAPRLVLFGGEVMPLPRLKGLITNWPSARFCNLYGPTETNVCTWHCLDAGLPDEGTLPIGRPVSETRIELRVGDRLAATGEIGEIEVSGPGVMTGYWNRPAATREAFRMDGNGIRWYRTGDYGRFDDRGLLHFHGRRDRMIKRHGHRVELGEIEHALSSHPEVNAAGVVALPADEGPSVRAFLVVRDTRPTIVELKRYCAERLPGYMIPDRFHFVESLPQTATGKVDLSALRQLIDR